MKIRADKLLVERAIVPTRERAQALILAGKVLVNEQKVEKAGALVESEAAIRLLGEDLRYVSRGGLKLERALEYWKINVAGRTCVDVGTSTGGFTDCMLQSGAARVIAIDTGYGQINAKLRSDPRVTLLERTNARYLEAKDLPYAGDFVAMDVSFISATLVLPAVLRAVSTQQSAIRKEVGSRESRVAGGVEVVILVKPQFEVGREKVGKGGIVRDPEAQREAVETVKRAVEELGGEKIEVIESPILGTEGNREFLLHAFVKMWLGAGR